MINEKEAFEKDLIKKFGSDAFITGEDLSQDCNDMVRISPRVDFVLGGGIPGGSVVTLAGAPKCGKTVTTLHILGKAQLAGRDVYYINVEGRIKQRDLDGIACLDKSKLHIVRSYRNSDGQTHIFSAEEFLTIVETIAKTRPGSVIVVDSISQLVTSGEMIDDIEKQSRAPGAQLMSRLCRKLSNVIPVNDIILIGILHVVANTSGYGKTTSVTGGNKIRYAMDIGLECKKYTIIREGGEDTIPIGQEVEWQTTSTAFAPPGQKTTSFITYGVGIDELREIVELGVEFGIIHQGGAWFTMSYMEDIVGNFDVKQYRVQGKANLMKRLKENKEEREALEKAFYDMIGY